MKVLSRMLPAAIFAALPVVFAQYAPTQCGHQNLQSPPPSHFRCGTSVMPKPAYLARAHLHTYPSIPRGACFDKTGLEYKQAITFQPDHQSSDGTCNTYSHGAGPATRVVKTPGVQYYNRACFSQPSCFFVDAYDSSGNKVGGVGLNDEGRAVVDPNESDLFYLKYTNDDGLTHLIDDNNGVSGQSRYAYPMSSQDYTVFGKPSNDNQNPLNCDLNPDNTLFCVDESLEEGRPSTAYSCSGYLIIGNPNTDPTFATCTSLTLRVSSS